MKPAPLLRPEATRESPLAAGILPVLADAPWPVAIFGIPFDVISAAPAAERIAAMLGLGRPRFAVAIGASTALAARHDGELRQVLLDADLVLSHSPALQWCSRLLGNPLPGPIVPADFLTRLSRLAAAQTARVYFLGIANHVVTTLQRNHPALAIVGSEPAADFSSPNCAVLAQRVREARPDLVIAYATNDHELRWLAERSPLIGGVHCIIAGRDGEFSELARPRAGQLCALRQSVARHLLRCQRSFQIALSLARELARDSVIFSRRHAARSAGPSVASVTLDWLNLDAGGDLTRSGLDQNREIWRMLTRPATHWALDVSHVERVDATGLAFLLHCRGELRRANRSLVLVAPSAALGSALATARLEAVFETARTIHAAHHRATPSRPVARAEAGTLRSLAWCGEIIAANAEDVWQMTSDYVRTFVANGATLVVVDLGRLRFIDSAGASLMLRVKKWARELRAEILFAHPQAGVREVLRVTSLDQLLLEGSQ